MLANLSVSNYALIDNITIDFDHGLTVLTGETGAGKSLIIDAISLLLGDRASALMVRQGTNKAIIEGVFVDYNPQINLLLESIGIDVSDNELIIKREININGKSISRVNGSIVTLTQLEEISSLLADIHTQLDTKKLFEVRNYVDFLDDDFAKPLINDYQTRKDDYLKVSKEYKNLKKQIQDDLENIDYLKYRYNELKSLNLIDGELEELEEELRILDNYETIYNNLYSIKSTFKDNDILDNLYEIKNLLEKAATYDSKLATLVSVVESSYYDLEDVEQTIGDKFKKLDFDSNRLDQLNDRINNLKNAERKYKMSISELINYQKELENKINNSDASDFILLEKEKELNKLRDSLLESVHTLTRYRKVQAKNLQDNILCTLKDLCLPNVSFDIKFLDVDLLSDTVFKEKGVDVIEFLVSFNYGEELKPLNKVASGGEMSRVMLAFKTHLLKNAKLSTVIFDEIDTGISGEIALSVANKIKEISKTTQVLSITHLPIVAAAADNHLFVYKNVENERTVTNIKKIELEERIVNIATMISSTSDETSINLAKQMIDKF